jgi:hypothetical protein
MSSLYFNFADQTPFFPELVFAVYGIELITRHFNVVTVAMINRIVPTDFSAPTTPITNNNFLPFALHI